MTPTGSLTLVLATLAASAVVAVAEPVSIMVLPADGTPVDAAITAAITRGARRVSPTVIVGEASLADTAFMAGCDPAAPACLDAVGAQLGVQQLVIVSRRQQGSQAFVDVAATHPGGAPTRRSFAIGADRQPVLVELEAAVPELLGATRATVAPPLGADPIVPGPGRDPGRTVGRGGLVIAIGGGVLAGVGLAMWGLASSTQADIDDAPAATPQDLEHLVDLESRGRTYASLGNGLVIAGSVAAVAGVGWILWDRRQQRYRSVRFMPVADAHSAGLSLEATW